MTRPLHSGFLASAARHPERPALVVAGAEVSFAALRERAAAVAATLLRHAPDEHPGLTGVFAYRSQTAFAGLLAALMRGHGYVPLNRTLPPARTAAMAARADLRTLIVDPESAEQLPAVLAGREDVLIVLPELEDVAALREALPGHRVLGAGDLEPADAWAEVPVDPGAIAYLIFTSGSTGIPKGVMVAHRNVRHYVDHLVDRYAITETDRFSQTHDLTFDNSVLDVWVAWERGACVCCPSQRQLINPSRWMRETGITVWFSVPSVAVFMRRLGGLKPGAYPSLRWSLFAGEALPVDVARAWREAAPNATLENLYGPTELTVDCTIYRWGDDRSPAECEHGVVPIGFPLPGLETLIADPGGHEVGPGEEGELLVAGPQVTLGYWQDPERTAASFVVPPASSAVHYRTGDRVRRPITPQAPITYLGRLDHQIKIRGVRVELGEIEAALRDATGVDAVVALGWPTTISGADGIEAFVGDLAVDPEATRIRLSERLPGHMVPRRIHLLDELPRNVNGKWDRSALEALLTKQPQASAT